MLTATKPLLSCGCAPDAVRRKLDGRQVPTCVHGTETLMEQQPDLTGRVARCAQCGSDKPSSPDLPFFRYRGPGSLSATKVCAKCGFHEIAHRPGTPCDCQDFQPHGAYETDAYYCGCMGW